jgi:hypothetical protein
MVKPLGTVSHALETVWNPHWDTNRVSPCNYAIKPYNEREVVGPWAYETVQWNYALRETSISYQSFTSWKPGRWNSPLRLALQTYEILHLDFLLIRWIRNYILPIIIWTNYWEERIKIRLCMQVTCIPNYWQKRFRLPTSLLTAHSTEFPARLHIYFY